MTTYPDMSDYCYLRNSRERPSKNIGWLGADLVFPKGSVPALVTQRLQILSCFGFSKTRGISDCPLCGKIFLRNNFGFLLGTAEIKIVSDDALYSSPDMIVHFILDHLYVPPDRYIEAVLSMDDPLSEKSSMEYLRYNVVIPKLADDFSYEWNY